MRAGIANPAKMSQREWARCLARGSSEAACLQTLEMYQSGGQAVFNLLDNIAPVTEKAETSAPGLALSGAYSGQGGLSMGFSGLESASVRCGKVPALARYRLNHEGNQISVRLLSNEPGKDPNLWQGQRIVLSLRTDGSLTGTGPIRVTGPVQVGTRQATKEQYANRNGTWTDYKPPEFAECTFNCTRTVTYSAPVYENRTVACTLGVMSLTGPVASVEGGVGGVNEVFMDAMTNIIQGRGTSQSMAAKTPKPGVRMRGRYASQDGLDIEFHPVSAVVGCRQVAFPRDYTVSASGGRVLVTIQNGAAPIVLELRTDETLTGSGSAKLEGKALMGMDVNARPVFQPASDTCTVGVLKPNP